MTAAVEFVFIPIPIVVLSAGGVNAILAARRDARNRPGTGITERPGQNEASGTVASGEQAVSLGAGRSSIADTVRSPTGLSLYQLAEVIGASAHGDPLVAAKVDCELARGFNDASTAGPARVQGKRWTQLALAAAGATPRELGDVGKLGRSKVAQRATTTREPQR